MYFTKIDDEDYAIKPMNCPGGMLVYLTQQHSYRDLPLRLGELGLVHRHELSGALHGLMRVRNFTQDDAHIFMLPSQIEDEIQRVIDLFDKVYSTFGLTYHAELSTRPEDLWVLMKFGKLQLMHLEMHLNIVVLNTLSTKAMALSMVQKSTSI